MDISTIYFILVPIIVSLVLFFLPEKTKRVNQFIFAAVTAFNLVAVCAIFGKIIFSTFNWASFDFIYSIDIKTDKELLLLIIAVFAFLSSIFAIGNLKDNPKEKLFNAAMILALGFANGAIISSNLIFMLAFIEALAIPFVIMILASPNDNKKLALKSFAITAVADLFLMFGIGIVYFISKSMNIFDISINMSSGLANVAFVCFAVGAAGKLGVMPFHSWMPEAAEKTPVPFLVFMATAVEKVLGVYILLVAVTIFNIKPGLQISSILMKLLLFIIKTLSKNKSMCAK